MTAKTKATGAIKDGLRGSPERTIEEIRAAGIPADRVTLDALARKGVLRRRPVKRVVKVIDWGYSLPEPN